MPYYRLGRRHQPEREARRHSRKKWIIILLVVALLVLGVLWIKAHLKPHTVLHQAKAVRTSVSFDSATKLYNEGDFTIQIPTTFQPVPRPPQTYQSYTWETSDSGAKGQQIEIFEDSNLPNFAVNRALIVQGQGDHLTVQQPASDDCQNFTRTGTGDYGQIGFLAKWQGVTFLCDANNTERDTIGTSSTDGVNTVILHGSLGATHKFFFTYTDHQLQPDYTVFYNALQSFQMN